MMGVKMKNKIFVVLLICFLAFSTTASAWDDNDYSNLITLDITSPTTRTDHIGRYNLTFQTGMESDFSDIKVYDDGDYVPHNIVEYSPSNYAIVDVRYNITSGSNQLDFYYNNNVPVANLSTFISTYNGNYVPSVPTWTRNTTANPVLSPWSHNQAWTDRHIHNAIIMLDDNTYEPALVNGTYHLYFSGAYYTGSGDQTQIGHATLTDLEGFSDLSADSNPITGLHSVSGVNDVYMPYALWNESTDTITLFYSYYDQTVNKIFVAQNNTATERGFTIKNSNNPILSGPGSFSCSAIRADEGNWDNYTIFYSEYDSGDYDINLATANMSDIDSISVDVYGEIISHTAIDDTLHHPNVFKRNDEYHMFVSAGDYGATSAYYKSSDKTTWVQYYENPWISAATGESWEDKFIYGQFLYKIPSEDKYLTLYTGQDLQNTTSDKTALGIMQAKNGSELDQWLNATTGTTGTDGLGIGENAEAGDIGGWTLESGVSYAVTTSNVIDGTYSFTHTSDNGGAESAYYPLDTVRTHNVSLEFDISKQDNNAKTAYIFMPTTPGDHLNGYNIYFDNAGDIEYYDGSFHDIGDYSASTVYHVRMDIYPSTDTYDIYIDDDLKVSGANDRGTTNGIKSFEIAGYLSTNWINLDNIALRDPIIYTSTSFGSPSNITDLAAPTLISPTNNSTQTFSFPPLLHDVTFTWSDTSAPSYRYEISTDQEFNLLAASGYSTSESTTASLAADEYWWRVKSYNETDGSSSAYSDIWKLTVNTTEPTISGTAINGVVYETKDGESSEVSGALVSIYNSTWSNSMTTGENGYYLFDELVGGDTYTLQATKQGYVDSSVELVNTVTDETITKNILMEKRSGAGDQYDFHYVKFTVKNIWDTRYSDVNVTVYEGTNLIEFDSGITGEDGSATFILNRDQEYRLTFINSTQGIDEELILYPKEDHYNVYVITTTVEPDDDYSSEEIDITVSKEVINNTHAYINVTYLDNLAETTSLNIYLNQSTTDDLFNQTVIDSYSVGTVNSTNVSFLVEDYAGETYFVNFDIAHTTFDEVKRSYAVKFAGMTEDHGFSQVYIWLAIGGIMFTGMLFKAGNARYGAFVVCVVAWVFIIMEWFDNLGDKGVLAITAGVTLATILSIAAIMAKGEKEG